MMALFKNSKVLSFLFKPGAFQSPVAGSRVFQWLSEGIARLPLVGGQGKKTGAVSKWLAVLMLFACIFIPRICIGDVSFTSIDLKVEDFLILLLAFLVLKSSVKEIGSCGATMVETAFLFFLIAAEISVFSGIAQKTIDKPFVSVLYLLKWAEYFLVFFVTSRLVRTERDLSFLIGGFFLFGLAIAGYGYWEHFFPLDRAVYPNYYRLFERGIFHGDANHIGGLLVLWIGFFTGVFLKSEKRYLSIIFLAVILFAYFPLIWTYSRKSYFALGGAMLVSLVFVREKKRLLLLILLFILTGLLFPTRLSERLWDLPEAITSSDPFHSSWAGNWVMWKESLWNFKRFALFGCGLGSRHRLYYESQYVQILTEIGILGVLAFLYLILSLIREAVLDLRLKTWDRYEGIVLGWLIGFTGLLIHGASCVSWTVSKIAIPFWFLAGIVFCFLKIAKSFPAESLDASN